jgi:hypothetical protein
MNIISPRRESYILNVAPARGKTSYTSGHKNTVQFGVGGKLHMPNYRGEVNTAKQGQSMVQILPCTISQSPVTSTGYVSNPASRVVHFFNTNIVNPELEYGCQHQKIRRIIILDNTK